MDQEHTIVPALAACTEEERQEAMGRFVVLQPHLNASVPLAAVARNAGVPSDPLSAGLPGTAPPGWRGW